MSVTVAVLLVVVALAVGALVGWLWGSRGAEQAKAAVDSLRLQLDEVRNERDSNRHAARDLAALQADARAFEQRMQDLTDSRDALVAQFREVGDKLLEKAQKDFLDKAGERFSEADKASETKLKELLAPVETTLKRYEEGLKNFDERREGSFGALKEAVSQMLGENEKTRRETQRLANVMIASPKARGRWGEEQLKNILESAGLRQDIDFFAQQSVVDDDDRRHQPDFIVKLPGGRSIVIDVKCPLVAFEQAFEEEDEEAKVRLLKQHAKAIRTYASDLGKKGYWAKFEEAPDFVVMFVPGEHHLSAAAERDLKLIEDSFRNGVIIASTINMLALAKFMAGLWKQEALNRQAQEIASHGRELHHRLATMAEHILNLGTHIGRAAKSYNSMIGSLDRNVLTQAKRFEELGAGSAKSIPDLRAVDVQIEESVKLVMPIAPPRLSNEDDAAA